MQYRTYGKTGLRLTALGFGAMRLPRDEDHAVEVIRRYLDLGGNYLDTARAYGESERILGRALQGRREGVYLATKNHSISRTRWDPNHVFTPEMWQEYMETSFANLGVDRVDFYHIHDITLDKYQEHFRGAPQRMIERALDEGSIGHLCFSSHDTPENIIKLIDEGIFSGMLVQYNLMDRRNEDAIACAHEQGLGVIIMGPVAGGRLAGPSERLGEALGRPVSSTPELALRFVLSHPHVTCAISGMNTLEQVEENWATASREEPLSPDELDALRRMAAENERLAQLYCTGCRYCVPCPQGVAIPEIFELMNYHRVWGLTESARARYARFGPENRQGRRSAAECVECGECEPKCPQHIPIIEQLKESHQALSNSDQP